MSDKIFFGVGCFNFGVNKAIPFSFTGKEYIQELRRVLESIPNIDKLDIQTNRSFEEHTFEVKEPYVSINNGRDFFPPSESTHIEEFTFEVYIPERIQKDRFEDGRPPQLGSEKFKVYCQYSYYMPVTIVEVISPDTDMCRPSDAVILVREFLREQFERSDTSFIRFECLGPSPFHADFSIMGSEPDKFAYDGEGYYLTHVPLIGYDRYEFKFNIVTYSDSNEALDYLLFLLEDEIGFYYSLAAYRVEQSRVWLSVRHKVYELLRNHEKSSIRIRLPFFRRQYKKVYEAFIAIAEFELLQLSLQHYSEREHDNHRESYLSYHIEKQISSLPNYPTKQFRDVVNLIEGRRSQTMENLIILFAAVVGGISGAVITILFTN